MFLDYREFYVQLSSFRNPTAFDKELNFGADTVRRYSISVNALTLDKLLTRLTEEVTIPEQDEEVPRAVSLVGRNTGIGGEPVWCLNRELTIGRSGYAIDACDYGLQWVSHLTESGNGGEIADQSLAAKVEGELTTVYFDAITHFLAGSLEKKIAEDVRLRLAVSELFGHDECLCFENKYLSEDPVPLPAADNITKDDMKITNVELERDNFLSQFYLASMGVIMANYQEVSTHNKM